MKKLIASAAFALMVAGSAGVAQAGHSNSDGTPGAHLPQDKGLCTAYFNGSDQGREKKRENGTAFQQLTARAEESTRETGQAAVEAYCGVVRDDDGNVTDDGMVGGNPDFDDPSTGGDESGGYEGKGNGNGKG